MTCENCSGTGEVEFVYPANNDGGSIQDEQREEKDCLDCDGTGEVEEDQEVIWDTTK